MARERLSDELIQRLRERASDPVRRNDARSISQNTVGLGSLLEQLGPRGAQLQAMHRQLQGLAGQLTVMTGMEFGDAGQGTSADAEPLPPAASPEQIASAEEALGRSFPDALRQLYAEVADGGFGPGAGLFPLQRLVGTYREMTEEPAGPQNQPWPANLLPLMDAEPGYDCLDLDSGEVIAWDPQEIDSYSNAAWKRSFKPAAPTLAAWVEEWLGRPTPGEQLATQQERWRDEGRRMAAEGMIRFYARKTPQERAEVGLPEVGWEEELLRRNGLL